MAQKKLVQGILFITKDKFDIFAPEKRTVLRFEFQPQAVKDNEVLDRENLYAQIKLFIENNKLAPSSLIIILGKSLLFEKDFPKEQDTLEQQQLKIQQYLENIPFESVGSKVIPLEKGFRVVATNADLYDSIKGMFVQHGFLIDGILPITLFGLNIDGLSADAIRVLMQKYALLKKHSLETETATIIPTQEEVVKKKKNITMIVAGVIMLIVAGIFIIYALFFLK